MIDTVTILTIDVSSMSDKIEVEVTEKTETKTWDAVVKDVSRNRAWSATGRPTASDATTEAVRGFLGDRRSAEYQK